MTAANWALVVSGLALLIATALGAPLAVPRWAGLTVGTWVVFAGVAGRAK